jgi:hypothetical protein
MLPGLVIWVVVSAAPPATRIHEFLALLNADPRQLVLVTSPAATSFIDEVTGTPVHGVADPLDSTRGR